VYTPACQQAVTFSILVTWELSVCYQTIFPFYSYELLLFPTIMPHGQCSSQPQQQSTREKFTFGITENPPNLALW